MVSLQTQQQVCPHLCLGEAGRRCLGSVPRSPKPSCALAHLIRTCLPDAPAPARLLRALPGTQGTQQSPTHVPITKAPHRSPLRSRSASCRHRHRHSRGHNSRRRSSLGHDGPMRPEATRTPARRKPRLASLGFGDRGARGIRTPDLFHAMEARYQLRHSPEMGVHPRGRRG